MSAPVPEKRPHTVLIGEKEVVDDLFWLRNDSDPAVMAHLEAENAYTAAKLAPSVKLEQYMYESLLSHTEEESCSIPQIGESGKWAYYERIYKGDGCPVNCKIPVEGRTIKQLYEYVLTLPTPDPNIYFDHLDDCEDSDDDDYTDTDTDTDTNTDTDNDTDDTDNDTDDTNDESDVSDYIDVGAVVPSPDDNLVAITIDTVGNELYKLYIFNFDDMISPIAVVEDVGSDVFWASPNQLYYTTVDEQHRDSSLWLYSVTTNAPKCVYVETDQKFNISCHKSSDSKYMFLMCDSVNCSEVRVARLTKPDEFTCIYSRELGYLVNAIEHYYGMFLWIDNAGTATNFQLVGGTDSTMGRVLLESTNMYLTNIIVQNGLWAVEGLHNARQSVLAAIVELADLSNPQWLPDFNRIAYDASVDFTSYWNDPCLYIERSTPINPPSTWAMNLCANTSELVKQSFVTVNPDKYEVQYLWAKSHDGMRIPITTVALKGLPKPAPVVQYGYGAYGVSTTTEFSSEILSLCDNGVMWVIAHVRGGSELGWNWYTSGRLQHKQNTFLDFIAVSEHLIAAGITEAGRIIPYGTSAGGLLVGAVLTMRPDLWAGAMSRVGFVDVLMSTSDATLPLTVGEWDEWGNPHQAADYEWINRYNPMTAVRPGVKYPSCLFTASLHDIRVGYWEPVKFAARLREVGTDVMVRIDMDSGHFSSTDRYEWLQELAVLYSWACGRLGLA